MSDAFSVGVLLPRCWGRVRENSPMHNMSSRDEDLSMACKPTGLEGNLTEVDTAFPPSALGQVIGGCAWTLISRVVLKPKQSVI